MGRLARGFELSLGRRLKRSKPFVEPRLAELPTNGRGLRPNASRDILEDEAVAVRPNDHTETSAHVVYVIPAS
jgi:hypothetical protein